MKKFIKFVLNALMLVVCVDALLSIFIFGAGGQAIQEGNTKVIAFVIVFLVVVDIWVVASFYKLCKEIDNGNFKIEP